MKSKKAVHPGLLVGILLVLIVAGLLLMIYPWINTAFSSTANPLKKIAGLNDAAEQQRVEKELKENAEKIFKEFTTSLQDCASSGQVQCECGIYDFSPLSNYAIQILPQTKRVVLVDSNLVPVGDNSRTYSSSIYIGVPTPGQNRLTQPDIVMIRISNTGVNFYHQDSKLSTPPITSSNQVSLIKASLTRIDFEQSTFTSTSPLSKCT